jgi:hypothetical protein
MTFRATLSLSLVTLVLGVSVYADDTPRVFVQGKGSENVTTSGSAAGGKHWGSWGSKSTLDSHDEAMEVTKNLQRDCHGVTVTLNQANADYTVMLNRESKQNRGLLRANSQVQVANRIGDILGTSATRTVGSASKDACALIVADWGQHGRIAAPDNSSNQPKPVPSPVVPASAIPAQIAEEKIESLATVQTQPATVVRVSTADVISGESAGDVAKRNSQHKACLELAKENPSVVCK